MAYKFDSQHIEAAYRDFDATLKSVKDDGDKVRFSDEITNFVSTNVEKLGSALLMGGEMTDKWVDKLGDYMETAITYNPKNIPSLLNVAAKIEEFSEFGDYGVLNKLAAKVTAKYPQYSEKALELTDKHLADYNATTMTPSIKTYEDFYKVYTNAYAKPKSRQMADRVLATANDIYYRIDFLKNDMKFDKSIQRISENPSDESLLERFETCLRQSMRIRPLGTMDDVLQNLKVISQIDEADTRGAIYTMVADSVDRDIPNITGRSVENKSDMLMKFINKCLKAEKDPEVKEGFALSAIYAMRRSMADEKGALVMAADKENQAFGALKKLAETAGRRFELQEMLTAMAQKYKDNPEKRAVIDDITIRALDSADDHGDKAADLSESEYIKAMRAIQKPRRFLRLHNTEICSLLNIEYAKSEYKFDVKKPLKPSRKDLLKAANLLSQYKSIDPVLYRLMLNSMDTKTFANVDDKVIDAFAKALDRVNDTPEKRKEFENELTEKRTQMHTLTIKQKTVNADAKPPHYVEKRNPAEKKEMPKFVVSFGKDEVNEG